MNGSIQGFSPGFSAGVGAGACRVAGKSAEDSMADEKGSSFQGMAIQSKGEREKGRKYRCPVFLDGLQRFNKRGVRGAKVNLSMARFSVYSFRSKSEERSRKV